MSKVKIGISPDYINIKEIEEFIRALPSTFQHEGNLLYDKRNVIKSFTISDTLVVVKCYKRPNFFQKVVYSYFRDSKAKRAFYNASELRKRSIRTPQEIAYIEESEKGLLNYGYYISKADFAPPIKDRLIEPEHFDKNMAKNFAHFAAELHEKGILHHDLNSTNVLYHQKSDNTYTFSVIDINRMTFFKINQQITVEQCFENLTRFTGRMDLFEYIIKEYIKKREWFPQILEKGIRIKIQHDEAWRKRKAFFKKFKYKK